MGKVKFVIYFNIAITIIVIMTALLEVLDLQVYYNYDQIWLPHTQQQNNTFHHHTIAVHIN